MSKPIKLTDDLINAIQKEFVDSIKKAKMFDGKLNYTKNFKWDGKDNASIVFSATAFAKMTMLVQNFESEVAWHGVAYRDETDKSRFHISDILVYPQVVTGATVNTDQEAYQTWLYAHDDEVFKNIRMQGHSHVTMNTTPSGVDATHQEKILSQIGENMFYIFMIWNKKFDRNIRIFDMANNTLYETEEINVYIGDDNCDLAAFLNDAKSLVKTKTYSYAGGQTQQGYYAAGKQQTGLQNSGKTGVSYTQKSTPAPTKATVGTPQIGGNWQGYNYGGRFDDDQFETYGGSWGR